MQNKTIRRCGLVAAGLLLANTACAFDMGNMMNPSKWMGGNKDRDRYDDGGYGGYGGGPGYGGYGGGPGYGGYGGPGYGGYGGGPGYGGYGGEPGYGYGGMPGYGGYGGGPGYGGYGGAPGYGAAPAYSAPVAPPPEDKSAAEIEKLKERIRQLEKGNQPPQPVWGQQGYEYR